MSSPKSSTQPSTALQKRNIPVQITDLPIFDNAYAFMKERFAEEMKRVDQQMTKFSTDLMDFYGQSTTVQAGVISSMHDNIAPNWDVLTSSPLVQGEGDDKTLKLQFDVSQFDPSEITVKVSNDVLIVSATHEDNAHGALNYREYTREFMLPSGTDPEHVVSSLSRDGVLIVQAPLPTPH